MSRLNYFEFKKGEKLVLQNINDLLEDGFKSEKYSAILGNLKDNGFLTKENVEILLKEYTNTQKIMLDGISREKGIIVSEALIDNYNRNKSDQI